MGKNCAPLLADLLLYSYESEFLDSLVKSGFSVRQLEFQSEQIVFHYLLTFSFTLMRTNF